MIGLRDGQFSVESRACCQGGERRAAITILDTCRPARRQSAFMNLLRVIGKSDVAALTPEVSVVSSLALVLGVLLLSLGLLLGSTPVAG